MEGFCFIWGGGWWETDKTEKEGWRGRERMGKEGARVSETHTDARTYGTH